jgi:Spy/CpxP family protein refolding chaperone
MRNNVVKFLVLGMFAFTAINANAQDKNNNEVSRDQKLQELKKDLSLTEAQVLKIKQIEDNYKEEKLELKKKMKEIRKKEFDEIDNVFTPEQKAKLKELRAKKHQNRKGAI